MDALIHSQNTNLHNLDLSGWRATLVQGEGGANKECTVSMADAASTPQSPRHMLKRRRLSRLLDKLVVQLRNNNHYPSSHWLMLQSQTYETVKVQEDAPLDLSIKAEPPQLPTENEKPAYCCGACGQTFTIHNRLMKHVASRHRNGPPEAVRAYECDVCFRRFARSDMLTRHARLHSGVKPYACSVCAQVFSRSDHLATHTRTHTGEKPYRCPVCPYAACRRDMITRHMRTHSKRPQTA